MLDKEKIKQILKLYSFYDENIKIQKYGNGHINETYKCISQKGLYILQGVNKKVFPNPEDIIKNICYLHKNCPNEVIINLETTIDGKFYFDTEKYLWRVYPFLENYISYESIETYEIGFAIGNAYGSFLKTFSHIDPKKLQVTIKNFHNATLRVEQLKLSYEKADLNKQTKAKDLYHTVLTNKHLFSLIDEAIANNQVKPRVAHNDTKINNVLLHKKDYNNFRVIDLDTLMQGTVLYDFGDMCRSAANSAAESELVAEKVSFDIQIFESLTSGYSVCKHILTHTEIKLLVTSIQYMGLMLASRFLTDFLEGDIYFKTSYNGENYIRARNQILLFEDIEKKKGELETIVQRYFNNL